MFTGFIILVIIILLGWNNQNIGQNPITSTPRQFDTIEKVKTNIKTLPNTPTIVKTPSINVTSTYFDGTRNCGSDPYPTLWANHQGPCGSLYPTYTPIYSPTAPKMHNSVSILPNGLFIEEYLLDVKGKLVEGTTEDGREYSYISFNPYKVTNWDEIPDIYERHPNIGGWYYWPRGGDLGGKYFSADSDYENITATIDGEIIFSEKCYNVYHPGMITAWTYNLDWMIQSYCQSGDDYIFEIIINGEHINLVNGYSESFALQLLNAKPFYMYVKDNKVWLRYADNDALLGYDGILLSYCCNGFVPPQHYERAITFYAYIGFNLFQVFIGKE